MVLLPPPPRKPVREVKVTSTDKSNLDRLLLAVRRARKQRCEICGGTGLMLAKSGDLLVSVPCPECGKERVGGE